MIERYINNPIITIKDVKPSNENLEVIGVFNCGATKYNGENILLIRVAEKVKNSNKKELTIPYFHNGEMKYKKYNLNDQNYDFSDERVIRDKNGIVVNLTSLSHFRIARSKDFYNFEISNIPTIIPEGKYEEWGVEDPRITKIEDKYYITYSAVSRFGIATSLIETLDFLNFKNKGVIFSPDNKDVSIFPEKINGLYYCYHRPVQRDIGTPNMWVASSPDLINWGNNEILLSTKDINWAKGRIGGGAPSLKLPEGWLHIFHAATINNKYQLGAFIADLNNPTKITHIINNPILSPAEEYEKKGFFGNVVFTNGLIRDENNIYVYYGAADDKIAVAKIDLKNMMDKMKKNR